MLLEAVASYLPVDDRDTALRVIFLSAGGYSTREIARRLEIKSKKVIELRDQMGTGLVAFYQAEGYTNGEISRTLGVGTAAIAGRYSGDG